MKQVRAQESVADHVARDGVARKVWEKPRLESLPLARTRGGFIMTTFEGPFNFLFGDS